MLQGLRAVIDAAVRWPVVLLWMLLIFALSSIPSEVQQPGRLPVDKAAHLVEFGVLGFLLTWMAGRRTSSTSAAVAAGIALTVIYGATDELHQAFVPGRDPSLDDLLADVVGAVAGAALAAAGRLLSTDEHR
jgi:VanZ family protein